MNSGDSEYTLLFDIRDRCAYEYILGKELTPEQGERQAMDDAVLQKRLIISLKRLNPWMSDDDIETAVQKVKRPGRKEGELLVSVNENLYEILTRGVVKLESEGEIAEREYRSVRFIDFEDCHNNEFLITRGFEVSNETGRTEFDIVVFVNGIPIVICERRQLSQKILLDEELLKKDIFSKLIKSSYEAGIAGTGMINIIYTNSQGYMGSITDDIYQYKGFGSWTSRDWETEPFVKENLLGLVKNGICFENSQDTGERTKDITSLSTMIGVGQLARKFEEEASAEFKMFYGTDSDRAIRSFASCIFESDKSNGYKIAIVTKRDTVKKSVERMTSISRKHIRNFKRLGDFLFEGIPDYGMGMIFIDEVAIERLVDFCSENFGVEELKKIVFIVDGFEHKAGHIGRLEKIFSKCMFFKFNWNGSACETGRGRIEQNELCKGPDKAVSENEIVRVVIKNKKTGFDTESSAAMNIEKKAVDILGHYSDFAYRQGFKGVVICKDEHDAMIYNEMITKHIHMLGDENIKTGIHTKRNFTDECNRFLKSFKEPLAKENTAIMIIDHIPDSSFEMPYVKAVYCVCSAKSQEEAERAISIGCISGRGKMFSEFTDYAGANSGEFIEKDTILKNININAFALSQEDMKRRLKELGRSIKELIKSENVMEKIIKIMSDKHKRAKYEAFYREFSKIMEELMGESGMLEYTEDFKWFSHIQAVLKASYSPEEGFDMQYMGRKGKRFLNEYFSDIGIRDIVVPISIFDGDFGSRISSLGNAVRAYSIENAIRRAIEVNLDKNPEVYEKLLEKLETILVDTEDNILKREERLTKLLEDEIEEDIVKARKLGISIDAYRVMGIVEGRIIQHVGHEGLLGMAVGISEGIMRIVEKNFVKGWNVKDEKLKAVEVDILNALMREYADMFKLDDMKNVSKELLHFAIGQYETLDFKKRAKEVSVDDFMREILD